ncbi:hypothetical protein BgiMline_011817 [Biomphalaria glabrata]
MSNRATLQMLPELSKTNEISSQLLNIFSCGKYCSCESNKDGNTIANCSLRNLKAIPLDLPNYITDLNLSWNQINLQSALHPPLCTIYGNLSTLTLAWNNIEKMSQVLTGCDKLVQLDLTGNKLQSLNAKTFLGLGKLVTLQGLEVANIEAETFKRVPNLQSLNFTYYGTFPNLRLFKDLHYLRELEIYFEKIARPDATLFHFERNNSLKILKLNSPLVKFFPNTLLSGLKSLEYLSFSAPSLSLFTLAKEGKPLQLKRLEIFNVRKVDPELLSGMSQLEVLKLHSVKNTDKLKLVPSIRDLEVFETTMNSIPDNWLFNLTFLVRLNLSEIPLDKIEHKDILHLKSLKFLEISGNAMTVLPSNFLEPLKLSLEKFQMHHCDLSKLDDNAISSMMVLQEIDLSNNYIEWIGEGNFVNIPYLRKLNLQNNIIHSMQINKGWFTTASELREINLSNNNLNNFPEALLDTNLTELALAGNNISVLPAQKLCGLESLSVLILADNPIHCDLSTEKLLNCLPGLQVDGKCETPSNVRNCKISELEICLHKLSSTSVTSEPTSTETKNSTKKRVMNMIQQDTESDVIVRPIVTLRYDEAVANSKSEVIQPSISTADNVEIAKLFGNEANRNTVISDQLLQKKQKENMKNDSDTTSNNTVHNAMNKSNVATSNISDEDTETFSLQAQKVNNSQIEPLSQLQSNMNNSLNDSTTVSNSFQSKYINMNNSVTDSASSNITSQSNYISVNNFTTERFTVDNTSQSTNISISNFTTNSATGDINILIKFEQSSNQQIYIQGKNDSFLNINDSLIPINLNDSTTVSNSFQSKFIKMNNSVIDSASSSITSQSNYISVNNFTTERFTVGNTSQSTNISISNFTTNSATGDVNILIFEQSSNQQIYIQGKNDPFLNINDSLIPIKTQEYNDTLNNTKVNLVAEMDQVSKPFEDLSTNTAGNKTILNSTFSLLTGIANVSMDIAQKENMKNDSDTTSNNTVHNAMNKSNVATSNISDEDTETFSLQAQKVNNSQIETLSQLQSNMNNSLNDSTTVSNSFQSKYINMNNFVTDSASSNITSQSNYISVNNFTTERFTVDNTSQSTNISISNFTTNSATGDVNILIKFEQSSNQQIYIQGKNDSFLNINDSLIPIKTQEYNDTLNNTKVNLVAEMDQVSKPFEDLSTNTAGNKTILNNTFSLLAGTANVSMDIALGDNINKLSLGSQSKVSKENDQPKWNASNITLDITSSKPFTANKNMSIYGIKSVHNTLFQVNTSEAENPGKELKQSFKSDLQNMSIINESTATPFKNVHTFQSYTKTTNNNVPMADWLTLSSSVKENLVLKNDSEMEGGINQVIQHTQGSYLSRSKGVEKTSPNSDSKPTLHSQDIKSQSLSNIEALSNNSYGPSSTPSESIFGPDSQIKIPAKEPVPVHIKEVEHTESPLGSLIATLIVVTLLILIMGGGFLWFKKHWQTGSYNAATRGSGQVDQVNISLASINPTS